MRAVFWPSWPKELGLDWDRVWIGFGYSDELRMSLGLALTFKSIQLINDWGKCYFKISGYGGGVRLAIMKYVK